MFLSEKALDSSKEDTKVAHFHHNMATNGATILAQQALILMRSITMSENMGLEGGCIKM